MNFSELVSFFDGISGGNFGKLRHIRAEFSFDESKDGRALAADLENAIFAVFFLAAGKKLQKPVEASSILRENDFFAQFSFESEQNPRDRIAVHFAFASGCSMKNVVQFFFEKSIQSAAFDIPQGEILFENEANEFHSILRGLSQEKFVFPHFLTAEFLIFKKPELTVYTDGGCSGNPGPGGWAFLVFDGKEEQCFSGGDFSTTNNRMELSAAANALQKIADNPQWRTAKINFFTDSQYLKTGIEEWIFRWKKNGWKTADKKPVKNKDLWTLVDALASCLDIDWHWVKGHADDKRNQKVDGLCQREISNLRGISVLDF